MGPWTSAPHELGDGSSGVVSQTDLVPDVGKNVDADQASRDPTNVLDPPRKEVQGDFAIAS